MYMTNDDVSINEMYENETLRQEGPLEEFEKEKSFRWLLPVNRYSNDRVLVDRRNVKEFLA